MHKAWYKELEEDDDNGFAQFGGYMNAKKAKLIKQVREQAGEERQSDLFKGVSIFVNGFTKPSAEELKTLMGLHGGVYHIYQMPSTTHIIASNLPNVKINKLGPLPIVKPSWIEDSITLGRLLDYTNYLLYTNQSRTQPKINFEKVDSSVVNVSSSKTASHPSFLSEFYGNSRLHLIATLGAEFKQYVNDLRAQTTKHQFPGLEELRRVKTEDNFEVKVKEDDCDDDLLLTLDTGPEKRKNSNDDEVIMHIDMDCFFVSVGIRNRPELRGKAVAVTHSKTGQGRSNVDRSAEIQMYKDRLPDGAECRLQDIDDNSSLSEIASCSYEARKMGVKNGMFMGQALKLCPDLRAIPYDFDDYKAVSKTLYTTIAEYTLNIEAVSCDEMYVSVAPILSAANVSVDRFASHIRAAIRRRTGCPCSTGFGANRLQARLATKRAKPDGQFHLKPSEVLDYFSDMPLSDLPGVGRATLAKMKHLGLETCGDVQLFSARALQKEVGAKLGETIFEQCAGVDKRPLQYEHERKSVSAEVNYGIRFRSKEESLEFLERLGEEVAGRLVETGMRAKCVTLKLMVRAEDAPTETAKYLGHGVCDNMSRSVSLPTATDESKVFIKESKTLLEKLGVPFDELRGVGIQLSKLEKGQKMNALLKNFLERPAGVNKSANITSVENIQEKTAPDPKQVFKVAETIDKPKSKPKISKNQNGATSAKGTKDLATFFKSTQKDRSHVKEKKSSDDKSLQDLRIKQMHDIDLDVLHALPEDIRFEIMNEYNLQLQAQCQDDFKSSQTPGPSNVSSTSTVRRENSGNMSCGAKERKKTKRKSKKESCSGFETLSHDAFIDMLANWFRSQAKPQKFDVEMLGKYFKDMAKQKKIEDLYVYVKYLHRNIGEKNDCDWHKAYMRIVNYLQEGMKMAYRNILRVPEGFDCGKLH